MAKNECGLEMRDFYKADRLNSYMSFSRTGILKCLLLSLFGEKVIFVKKKQTAEGKTPYDGPEGLYTTKEGC